MYSNTFKVNIYREVLIMKITKKSFIDEMINNPIYFIGVTQKLIEKDELFCRLADLLNDDNSILEQQTYKARSKDLVSNSGSVLSFNQIGNYTFYKYEYTNNKYILICLHTYFDDFDNINRYKAMYYYINKQQ